MDRLIYTALAGINERRPQRQVEANDLANVSTVGFKKSFDHLPSLQNQIQESLQQLDSWEIELMSRAQLGRPQAH